MQHHSKQTPRPFPCHRSSLIELYAFLHISAEAKDILPLLRDGICFSSHELLLRGLLLPTNPPFGHVHGRLWASLDVRKTLLSPVFCGLRSALPPRWSVPEPSICFCWALEMPSAGPSAIKQGKNRFSGPFPEASGGLRQHCDDAWGGHFPGGGLGQSFLASSRVPESRMCFPFSAASAAAASAAAAAAAANATG